MKMLTLDTMGYLSNPSLIVDRTFRNFFVANYSQSSVHHGDIKSLPYLITKNAENYYSLASDIRLALEMMLSGYFDNVEVECTIDPISEAQTTKQIITVNVDVYRGLNKWSAGRLLTLVKNRISKIENSDYGV